MKKNPRITFHKESLCHYGVRLDGKHMGFLTLTEQTRKEARHYTMSGKRLIGDEPMIFRTLAEGKDMATKLLEIEIQFEEK